jgi:hypothetical protein
MSTPISRDNNKLEGHEFYAPRSVRQKLSEDDTAQRLKVQEREMGRPYVSDPWYASRPVADPEEGPGYTRPEVADSLADMQADGPVNAPANMNEVVREVFDAEPIAPIELASRSAGPAISSQGGTGRPPSSFDLLGRSRRSTSVRRRFLRDPDIVPEPPIGTQGRGPVALLVRFSLMIGVAAMVASGVTMISSSNPKIASSNAEDGWQTRASGSIAAFGPIFRAAEPVPQQPSRLIADDQQAFVNDPLPLGIAVADEKENESLMLNGLATGTRVSAGAPVGASSWRVGSNEVRGLYLYAPRDFVGVMNTGVDLLAPDKRVLDSRAVRLKWVAQEPAPTPPTDQVVSASPAVPALQPMNPAEAAVLMSSSQDFLTVGDIEAARIGFRRLADADNAAGALALAFTYDPRYLAEHNVVGVHGDDTKARALYRRAKELGSAEAGRVLAQMATK